MADVTLYKGETRSVEFPVTASADPLADVVQIAFITEGAEPQPSDWKPAAWVTGQTWAAGKAVYVGVEIGPGVGDITLDYGTYATVVSIGDTVDNPWLPVGTIRIRRAIAATALRDIRSEVGASPADDEIADLYAILQSVPGVALAILRPRLADALAAAAAGSFSIPGALSLGAPAQPTMLLEQVQRLEAQLLAETGTADDDALGRVVKMRRCDQARGLSWLP